MCVLVGLLVEAASTQPPLPLLQELALKLVTSLPASALGAASSSAVRKKMWLICGLSACAGAPFKAVVSGLPVSSKAKLQVRALAVVAMSQIMPSLFGFRACRLLCSSRGQRQGLVQGLVATSLLEVQGRSLASSLPPLPSSPLPPSSTGSHRMAPCCALNHSSALL